MKRIIQIVFGGLITLTLIFASSCERPPTIECFPGKSLPLKNLETTESKYLPRKIVREDLKKPDLEDEKRLDKFISEFFLALKELSLLTDLSTQEESYRFLWLRSFHEPISLRVSRIGNTTTLFIKKSDGKGGYEPGKLILDTTKSLSPEEWQKFMTLLENSCFWGMNTWDGRMGFDGAVWILEAVKSSHYRVIFRKSPGGGDFQGACLYLLELSGLKEEIY